MDREYQGASVTDSFEPRASPFQTAEDTAFTAAILFTTLTFAFMAMTFLRYIWNRHPNDVLEILSDIVDLSFRPDFIQTLIQAWAVQVDEVEFHDVQEQSSTDCEILPETTEDLFFDQFVRLFDVQPDDVLIFEDLNEDDVEDLGQDEESAAGDCKLDGGVESCPPDDICTETEEDILTDFVLVERNLE